VSIGNVIHLTLPPPIEVVNACSGLRMLICFLAITFGAAFIADWGPLERLVIVLSGIPIAIISNVLRIAATGWVQHHFGAVIAEKVFHDFAGWLMMPVACALVAIELWMLQRAFPPVIRGSEFASEMLVNRRDRAVGTPVAVRGGRPSNRSRSR
jgi:exosortase/archaeosortase family protein